MNSPSTSASEQFQQFDKALTEDQEEFWNSLSHDQQIMAFCAISRRLVKGELEDRGTYRWVLYDVFGWGPESYLPCQLAGYLALHNAIGDGEGLHEVVTQFAHQNQVPQERVQDFLEGRWL